MTYRLIIATALAASLSVPMTTVGVAPASAGDFCQAAHSGKSLAFRKKSRAIKRSKRVWEKEARRKFGMRYNKWENGNNLRVDCYPTGRQFWCQATANACAKKPLRQRLIPTGTVTTTELG